MSKNKLNTRHDNFTSLSSCTCYECNKNKYAFGIQRPKNCNFSPYFECKNRLTFKMQEEPVNKTGFEFLNPLATTKSYAKDFVRVPCADGSLGKDCSHVYYSSDPRLISLGHNGQVLPLDRPPIDEFVKLSEVYTDPRLNYYGQVYGNYSDINAGQITYYIDKSIEDTLFKPLFVNDSVVDGEIYKDPMGSTYPEYKRIPLKQQNVLKTRNRDYEHGLSWLEDSIETREDLMNLQMRQQDRRRYEPRWTGNRVY